MKVFINPGSGPCANGSKEQSEINIKQFIEDAKVECEYRFVEEQEDGRHLYILDNGKMEHEIEMPAIPLENVRYLDLEGQNIWDFPRLYVDGSSWVWMYAIEGLFEKEEE